MQQEMERAIARLAYVLKNDGRFEAKAINHRNNETPFIWYWRVLPAKIGRQTNTWTAVQREGFESWQQDRYRRRLESIVKTTQKLIRSPLTLLGNTLTIVGCLGLLLALSGVIDASLFAIGLSSGIRVIGTVAITGCLLSAIGYGLAEYFGK